MIKQIQLRGISRSPSDRMTEDGGLDESLNLYLDNAESAPALVPDDVTSILGLPDDLQADKVFVHKTANYEHVVVQKGGKVVAYVGEEEKSIANLANDEHLRDINSVGNTLILATDKQMYYVLYKKGEYNLLGNKVPFPYINFWADHTEDLYHFFLNRVMPGETVWFERLPSEENWNKAYEQDRVIVDNRTTTQSSIRAMLNDLWSEIDAKIKDLQSLDLLSGQVFFRYAVELYDGSQLSSMPILVSASSGYPYAVSVKAEREYFTDNQTIRSAFNKVEIDMKTFSPKAKMASDISELLQWEDVIKRIRIYMSIPSSRTYNRAQSRMYDRTEATTGTTSFTTTYDAKLFLGSKLEETKPEVKLLELSSQTFLIETIEISTSLESTRESPLKLSMAKLVEGCTIPVSRLIDTTIEVQPILNYDDMKHYALIAERIDAFNGRTMLLQPSQIIDYDYNRLNSFEDIGGQIDETKYIVTYVIDTEDGEKVVPKTFTKNGVETYHAFQVFPDSRASRMKVRIKRTVFGETFITNGSFEMKPHPFLDCAYYYGGLDKTLEELCSESVSVVYLANKVERLENKLVVSQHDNPFYFPIKNRYTFQSRVLGVAIATTALSQGQFGQFPLYVFTEDGVWAMETAADGSFVTSKPLSRDICTNPDSITSIDNAVVFVTDKGVMLLQGSQVVNISPYMNGRHYTINDSAQEMLALSDYASLLPSLTDEDTFMGFVKKASVAYDYAGKRLVFIKEDEEYQYVYKLDTQTWHKLKHEQKLMAPINSYPECLVQGKEERHTISLYVEDAGSYDERTFELFQLAAQKYGLPLSEDELYTMFYDGMAVTIDLMVTPAEQVEGFISEVRASAQVSVTYDEEGNISRTRIYDLSTVLDGTREQSTELGCIVTRPLDLGYADIKKVIKDVRIRGEYAKGHVQYILQGSDDGVNYFNTSLKQKSWKLFRIIIVCALDRHERISWVDVDLDIRYNNKLR